MAIAAPTFWYQDVAGIAGKAAQIFQSWGLEVMLGEHAMKRYYKFAGEDSLRFKDLQIDFFYKSPRAANSGYTGRERFSTKLLSWVEYFA